MGKNMLKIKGILTGMAFVLLAATVPVNFAHAANPKLEVKVLNRSQFRFTVKSANSNKRVDVYYHQSDSDGQNLWNAILNVGRTDRNGKFSSSTQTINSYNPELNWTWYAVVNGVYTPIVITKGTTRR